MKKTTPKRKAPRAAKAASAPTPEEALFASVVDSLIGQSKITQAKMFGATGLKVGGKVFSMVHKGRLVVKLPAERVAALIKSGDGAPFDPGHGKLMKEWVAVKPMAKGFWINLAEEAKDFVESKMS